MIISPLFKDVNKYAVLTSHIEVNKFTDMRYGDRLRRARGEMTQAMLSEISGVSQSLISQLENSTTATGSEYTPRLARALRISVDWLADEMGEMVQTTYSTSDPKLVAMLKVMEPQADYVKDAAISAVLTTCELAARAKNNGTHG